MIRNFKSWWQWFYLLGLDAPLIAVLWLLLFAKTWRVDYHPWEVYAVLGAIVWAIRIADQRLRSAIRSGTPDLPKLLRTCLKFSAAGAALVAAFLTLKTFPLSGYNYLFIAGIMLIGYFALSLFSSPAEEENISYAKHAIGGIGFAFTVSMMAHAYLPSLAVKEMVASREFVCFAVLCVIASASAELWSRELAAAEPVPRYQDQLAISLPLTLLGAASLVFAVQSDSMIARPFFYCILTGAALLQVMNRVHRRFSLTDVKFLTSLCLLLPGLVFQAYEISR